MTVQQYKNKNVMYLTTKNYTPDMQQEGNGKVKKIDKQFQLPNQMPEKLQSLSKYKTSKCPQSKNLVTKKNKRNQSMLCFKCIEIIIIYQSLKIYPGMLAKCHRVVLRLIWQMTQVGFIYCCLFITSSILFIFNEQSIKVY